MTAEQIERDPHFRDFIANFARHCGAPRSVFLGQLAMSVTALLKEYDEYNDRTPERPFGPFEDEE